VCKDIDIFADLGSTPDTFINNQGGGEFDKIDF
jgi:hypothetical protein